MNLQCDVKNDVKVSTLSYTIGGGMISRCQQPAIQWKRQMMSRDPHSPRYNGWGCMTFSVF